MKPRLIEFQPVENPAPQHTQIGSGRTNITLLFEDLGQIVSPEEAVLTTVEDMRSAIIPSELFPASEFLEDEPTKDDEQEPDTKPHVKILSDDQIEIGGQTVLLQPAEVGILNLLLLNPGKRVYRSDVRDTLKLSETHTSQSLSSLFRKCSPDEEYPAAVVRERAMIRGHWQTGYAINLDARFADVRTGQPDKRIDILGALCKEYASDPRLLAALRDFTPADLHTARLSSWRLYNLQKAGIARVEEQEQDALVAQLDEAMQRIIKRAAAEQDRLTAAIAARKLCYSMLGFAEHLAHEATLRQRLDGFNDLQGSTDDMLQAANVALVEAVYSYDKTRGASLDGWVKTIVNFRIRDERFAERRHYLGLNDGELKTHTTKFVTSGPNGDAPELTQRRIHESEDSEASSADWLEAAGDDRPIEELIGHVSARRLLDIVFDSPVLRPVEKLILSMTFGVYDPQFEDVAFTVSESKKVFVYNQGLRTNIFFRDGVPSPRLGQFFDISRSSVHAIRTGALEKARDAIIATLVDYEDGKKWANWMWEES